MTHTEADVIITNCPQSHKDAQLARAGFVSEIRHSDGRETTCCTDCWNAHVAARKEARKAELNAWKSELPACDRCGKAHAGNWTVARFSLCGRCKNATKKDHNRAVANMGSMAFLAMGSSLLASTDDWAYRKAVC